MDRSYWKPATVGIGLTMLCIIAVSCRSVASNEEFFGKTVPPERNILRYVNGDEPESLDPAVSSGQPEGRIYLALHEGLVEYDPRTLGPIPALAEHWDSNNDSSEFVFHLRKNARWSNGDPITAGDFVYSVRRALSPELAARSAYLAYYIKYSQAYNEGAVFVKDPQTNQFLLEKDLAPQNIAAQEGSLAVSQKSLSTGEAEYEPTAVQGTAIPDTPFHQFMHAPARVTLPGSEQARGKLIAANPKLQAAVAGKQFIPVTAEDIGVEAVDDYTVRISLSQPAPYFIGLLAYQLFRVTPKKIIEQYKEQWTDPSHIVTSGPFKLKSWKPYSEVVVERNPMYWDAASVQLDEIHFYVSTDHPTSMNLYKVGEADAVLNHSVPDAWLDVVRPKKDYMDGPEAAITYILMNVTQPPMNDLRVRRAFNMAIDKVNYSKSR